MKFHAVMLVIFVGVTAGRAQPEPKVKATPAQVIVVDAVTGFSRGDKHAEYRLQAPPKGDPLADAVYVEIPLAKAPKTNGNVDFLGRKVVAVHGRLILGKTAVGQTGAIPPRPITAASLRIVADKIDILDDKNKADFPAAGKASVRGKLIAGKFRVKDGEVMMHAIENGDAPIVLIGKVTATADQQVRAVGRLRLVRGTNAVVLEVESLKNE